MTGVLAVGEALVEFIRIDGRPLGEVGTMAGPFPSGAPAIFASAVARLGVPSALCAVVGHDAFGDALLSRLQADGVDTTAVRIDATRPTSTAHVAYGDGGERTFVFHVEGAAGGLLDAPDLDALAATPGWLHVSGATLSFGPGPARAVLAAAERVLAADGRMSLDPNVRPETMTAEAAEALRELAARAQVLFPSEAEVDALGLDPERLAAGGAVVCVTRGAEGVDVVAGAARRHVAAIGVREVDPTSAGDHFAAGFVAATLLGRDPADAAAAGCAVAARAVAVVGTMEAPLEPLAPA
jgi:fructokinase